MFFQRVRIRVLWALILSMVDRSVVGWGSMNHRHSMDKWSMIGRSSMDSGNTFIGDISNITTITISMVVDILDTTIRKSNSVGSFNITISISSFSSIVVSTRVVIMHSILIGVRRWNLLVHWSCMDYRGMVGRGSMVHRGVVLWLGKSQGSAN